MVIINICNTETNPLIIIQLSGEKIITIVSQIYTMGNMEVVILDTHNLFNRMYMMFINKNVSPVEFQY